MFFGIKSIIVLGAMVLGLNAAVQAKETTRKYDFKDFNTVEAGYGMYVKISQSNSYAIEVKADERDFEHFKAEKNGDRVRFYIDKNIYRKRGETDITINISMPALTGLTLSGGAIGEIKMDISKNFATTLSGGADLKGNLKCADASFSLSGGSSINLSGSGKELKAEGSGGCTFELKHFAVTGADVALSGGCDADLTVNGKLRTTQSGGTRVTYSGKTVVERTNLSGGSKIIKE